MGEQAISDSVIAHPIREHLGEGPAMPYAVRFFLRTRWDFSLRAVPAFGHVVAPSWRGLLAALAGSEPCLPLPRGPAFLSEQPFQRECCVA